MKPKSNYEGELRLFLGDCLDILKDIETNSIDMVCADPPYGTTACKWDSVIPLEPMWIELKRIAKKNTAIVMTASQPFTTKLISSNPKMFKYCWVWDKRNPTGFLNAKKQPLRVAEDIAVFYASQPVYNPILEGRGKPRSKGSYNKPGGSDCYGTFHNVTAFNNTYYPVTILSVSNALKKGKLHPTQKPVPLMEYLIKTYTNEGQTVLDFCMGSGTTGVAAIKNNRQFIGIEKEKKYFEMAKFRIELSYYAKKMKNETEIKL